MTDERKLKIARYWKAAKDRSESSFRSEDGASYSGLSALAHSFAVQYAEEVGLNGTDAAVAEMRNLLRKQT